MKDYMNSLPIRAIVIAAIVGTPQLTSDVCERRIFISKTRPERAMSRRRPLQRRPDYRPPEPLADWHFQDWLLIVDTLEYYTREKEEADEVTAGQEIRLCTLVESITRMYGLPSLGAVQHLNVAHFDQYDRRHRR